MSVRSQKVGIRQVASRLLARRPDLAGHRRQRREARAVAESVDMNAAAVDVLAGWLGVQADSDVADLDNALADAMQLHLASLRPRKRRAADTPETRAEQAIELGWTQLQGHGPREILRILVLLGGGPLDRSLVEEASETGAATLSDLIWSGFVREEDDGRLLFAYPEIVDFVATKPDAPGLAADRPRRFALSVRRRLVADSADEEGLGQAADLATDLAVRFGQRAVAASVTHRMCERLRSLGQFHEARQWVDRGLELCNDPDDPAWLLRGMLQMDNGLLHLGEGAITEARAALDEAVQRLEEARERGTPGALEAQERARLYRAQCRLAAGEVEAAERDLEVGLQALLRRHSGLDGGDHDPEDDTDSGLSDLDDRAAADIAEQSQRHALSSQHNRSRAACLAVAELELGRSRLARGDVSDSLRRVRRARDAWREVAGEGDPLGAAFALAEAQALRAAGRFTEVEEPLEAARVLSGGDMDRLASSTLPIALHDLGVAAADRKDSTSAATLLDEAAMMSSSLLIDDHAARPRISYTRALLYLADGDLDRARSWLKRLLGHEPELDDAMRALVEAAEAWTRSREGAHRYRSAETVIARATEVLSAWRGPESMATAHLRILRESLLERS